MEIWEPKPPGTLWATPGLLRESFTFTFFIMANVKERTTKKQREINRSKEVNR
jgi:hypothetical protein